jgi:hypothetical protein
MNPRTIGTIVVALLLAIGALTVVGFVVDALRWLLGVAVVVAVVALVVAFLGRNRSNG